MLSARRNGYALAVKIDRRVSPFVDEGRFALRADDDAIRGVTIRTKAIVASEKALNKFVTLLINSVRSHAHVLCIACIEKRRKPA